MTPFELSERLLALDWSGCSLQHQLAVACAISTLEWLERDASLTGDELTDLIDRKLGRDSRNRALAFGLLNHFDVRVRAAPASNVVAFRPHEHVNSLGAEDEN